MIDTSTWSLKRLAWAYGCEKKGSDTERELGIALVARIQAQDDPADLRPEQRYDQLVQTSGLVTKKREAP